MYFDDEELQTLHDELKVRWEQNLKVHEVKWPKNREKILELLCLYSFINTPLTQDEIEIWIAKRGGHYKRQARHHSRHGWYIVSGNKKSHYYKEGLQRDQIMMVSFESPNPIIVSDSDDDGKENNHIENLANYYSVLRTLQKNKIHDNAFRCSEWMKLFEYTKLDINSNQWNSEHVSTLLGLVHPDEYFDQRGVYFGDDFETPHSKKKFNRKKYDSERCEIDRLIPNVRCPYVQNNTVQMDHYWPHSLGGPTSNSNMMFLCKTCNQQKSSSPYLYDFSYVPTWLRNRIKIMHNLKSRSW
jgi:hypothetical protein